MNIKKVIKSLQERLGVGVTITDNGTGGVRLASILFSSHEIKIINKYCGSRYLWGVCFTSEPHKVEINIWDKN
jgi:hypothetical protein